MLTVKLVAKLFFHNLQFKEHRVEHHKEHCRAQGITLKYTTTEGERLRSPERCLYHSPTVAVKTGEVGAEVVRDMIPPEGLHYEGVRNAPEGVFKIKEGNMGSPLGLPCILNNLLHGQIVLNAPIDSRQESFLQGRVHKVVLG